MRFRAHWVGWGFYCLGRVLCSCCMVMLLIESAWFYREASLLSWVITNLPGSLIPFPSYSSLVESGNLIACFVSSPWPCQRGHWGLGEMGLEGNRGSVSWPKPGHCVQGAVAGSPTWQAHVPSGLGGLSSQRCKGGWHPGGQRGTGARVRQRAGPGLAWAGESLGPGATHRPCPLPAALSPSDLRERGLWSFIRTWMTRHSRWLFFFLALYFGV